MWTVFSVVLTIFLCSKLETVLGGSFNPAALSKYNDFAKTPLNPETIQTGGRLIERHLQYLAQAGFKSILSVVEFTTNDTVYNGVSGSFPASAYEMSLAASYGLSGKYVASQLTPDYANSISAIIDDMPKPLYIHCHVSPLVYLLMLLIGCIFILPARCWMCRWAGLRISSLNCTCT